MSLPPSTANWHWKTKHVTPWARQWFERELPTLEVKGDGNEIVRVELVTNVDGDVEVGQRKSKLITIYDCKVELKWSGTASDGTTVSGTLRIPEVSHENAVDSISDYTYNWTLDTSSSAPVDALYKLVRSRLPTALETKLAEFPVALIEAHGKDLTVSSEPSPASSQPSTPQPGTAAVPVPAQAVRERLPQKSAKVINTETISVEARFQASADDLFSILTDEKRIPHWSRAPAQSKAEVGTEYSLFGGGVKGTYTTLTPAKRIVQTWVLNSPIWPAGHIGTLTTTLDQSDDSTNIVFSLAGVPKGLEDETRRNLEGYYVQGLKSIGYVQLIFVPRSWSPSSPTHSRRSSRSQYSNGATSMNRLLAVVIALLALGTVFAIPWISSRR